MLNFRQIHRAGPCGLAHRRLVTQRRLVAHRQHVAHIWHVAHRWVVTIPWPAPAAGSSPPSTSQPDHGSLDASAWPRWISALRSLFTRWLSRPRTRLAIIGVVLLVVAVLGIVSSVWTLPLVIIGAAMVLVAWIGARLDGRFAVEWGEAGTQLEFRAQIKAPARPAALAPSRRPPPSRAHPGAARRSRCDRGRGAHRRDRRRRAQGADRLRGGA